MDDWNSVSHVAPPSSATDPSDAVSAPQPQRRKVRQSVKLSLSRRFVLLGLAVLLIVALVGGIIEFVMYHVSDTRTSQILTATATPQQPSASHPHLAASYRGTRHNTTYGDTETFTLTSVVQNNSQISGVATIADGAHGSGPFTGVVSGNSINFTETTNDNSGTITFTGTVNSDSSMSGTFVYPGYGEGTWQVSASVTNSMVPFTSDIHPPGGWHVISSGTISYDGSTYGQPWIAPINRGQYPNGVIFQATMTPQTSCEGTRLGAIGIQDQQGVRVEIILDCGAPGIYVCIFPGTDNSQINPPNNLTRMALQQVSYTVQVTVNASGNYSTYLLNGTEKQLLVSGQIASPVAVVLDGYNQMNYTSLSITSP